MNRINLFVVLILLHFACTSPAIDSVQSAGQQKESIIANLDSMPVNVRKIIACYPAVIGYSNNQLLFSDGSKMVYDDGKKKSKTEVLLSPDVEDMFCYDYKSWSVQGIPPFHDPGRIRVDSFFMKIYGANKSEVQRNLVKVKWCPKLVNQDIMVTRVNNVHLRIDSISKELDQMPQFKEYLQNIGGTFNWRNISGTNRLSAHSFGMTIDINTKFSNYWQWDCQCKDEEKNLSYANQIPPEIVNVFEKYGFIWGGNWYHYDTMHFEYRPELL